MGKARVIAASLVVAANQSSASEIIQVVERLPFE